MKVSAKACTYSNRCGPGISVDRQGVLDKSSERAWKLDAMWFCKAVNANKIHTPVWLRRSPWRPAHPNRRGQGFSVAHQGSSDPTHHCRNHTHTMQASDCKGWHVVSCGMWYLLMTHPFRAPSLLFRVLTLPIAIRLCIWYLSKFSMSIWCLGQERIKKYSAWEDDDKLGRYQLLD